MKQARLSSKVKIYCPMPGQYGFRLHRDIIATTPRTALTCVFPQPQTS